MRSFSHACFFALASLLGGCGAAVSAAPQDAGPVGTTDAEPPADVGVLAADDAPTPVADAAVDTPFVMADHTPYPSLPNNGGPTLSHVKLVTITYSDDPNAASDATMMQYIVGSDWLTQTGADYGIGTGMIVQNVVIPTPAPDTITSTELETDIVREINAGTVPSPSDGNFANYLYMVFYPAHTTITETVPGYPRPMTSCRSYGGYHDAVDMGAYHFAYAVIPDCGAGGGLTDADGISVAASHELIEAASDALPLSHPAYVLSIADQPAWNLLSGPEIGDLCDQLNVRRGGYLLQRVWSNSAAAANLDPCVPAPNTTVGFNVSTSDNVIQGSAGQSVTVDVWGWSTAPVPNWQVYVMPMPYTLSANLDHQTMNNGVHATLTIDIPTNANPFRPYGVVLLSTHGNQTASWPVSITLQ